MYYDRGQRLILRIRFLYANCTLFKAYMVEDKLRMEDEPRIEDASIAPGRQARIHVAYHAVDKSESRIGLSEFYNVALFLCYLLCDASDACLQSAVISYN